MMITRFCIALTLLLSVCFDARTRPVRRRPAKGLFVEGPSTCRTLPARTHDGVGEMRKEDAMSGTIVVGVDGSHPARLGGRGGAGGGGAGGAGPRLVRAG